MNNKMENDKDACSLAASLPDGIASNHASLPIEKDLKSTSLLKNLKLAPLLKKI